MPWRVLLSCACALLRVAIAMGEFVLLELTTQKKDEHKHKINFFKIIYIYIYA